MEYTKYREWKRRMQASQNCIYNAKARIYIQFNGKDSSDDKSVKIGYPMAQEARMAAGAAKSKGAESFPICPPFKNIFALHPRFPHLFGGEFWYFRIR